MTRILLWLSTFATRMARRIARRQNLLQALTGAIALGLGFWGWMLKEPPANAAGWFNNIFRTLQLITLNFPTNIDGSLPWQLQVARLAVPIVAALATFNILIGTLTRPVRLALVSHSREHFIVCGAEQMTSAALNALAERGRQIVSVGTSIKGAQRDALEAYGLTVVEADPFQPATFPTLSTCHAAAVFLTSEEDITNLNLAMLVLEAAKQRDESAPPLILGVLIDREDLATELDAALDGLSRRHHVRYRRLCPDREGIQLEMQRFAPVLLKNSVDERSHTLVVGLGGNWQQVLIQLIIAMQDQPDERPRLTLLLDEDETKALADWRALRPALELVVEIVVIERGPGLLPSEDKGAIATPHLAVVMRKDGDAIATMLALRRPGTAFSTGAAPILVRQSREDRLLSRLSGTEARDRDMKRLVAFGGLLRPDSIERVLDRKGDRTAIALHARYLGNAETLGVNSPAALESWDNLAENLRDANRASAAHAPILFAALNLAFVPKDEARAPVTPDAEEIERLAQVEHRRWLADRIDRGWRHGPARDDRRRLHPSLVPFEELTPADREKDRNAVRALIAVHAEQGLVLQHMPAKSSPAG